MNRAEQTTDGALDLSRRTSGANHRSPIVKSVEGEGQETMAEDLSNKRGNKPDSERMTDPCEEDGSRENPEDTFGEKLPAFKKDILKRYRE